MAGEQTTPNSAVDGEEQERQVEQNELLRKARKKLFRIGLNVIAAAATLAIAVLLITSGSDNRPTASLSIGTGSVSGLYFPIGGIIQKYVNNKSDEYGFKVIVETTDGSIDNIRAVLSGEREFGIAQADVEYQAVNGLGREWVTAQTDLRAVCSFHQEMVTLVASDDSGIRTAADLRGKRVAIGQAGSGQRKNAEDILRAVGLDSTRDVLAREMKITAAVDAFHRGELDAFFYTVGHPNNLLLRAFSSRPSHIVSIGGSDVDSLLESNPFYRVATLPAATYPQATGGADIQTIGMSAVLVTSARVDDRLVYATVRTLFENLIQIQTEHPAFAGLSRASMQQGFAAPVHDGARTYYEQTKADNKKPQHTRKRVDQADEKPAPPEQPPEQPPNPEKPAAREQPPTTETTHDAATPAEGRR